MIRNRALQFVIPFVLIGVLFFLSASRVAPLIRQRIDPMTITVFRGLQYLRIHLADRNKQGSDIYTNDRGSEKEEVMRFENVALREENERLKGLLNFKETNIPSLIGARVLFYANDFGKEFFMIDRGEHSGVRVNSLVVENNQLVVGVVIETSDETAKVAVHSNPGMAFDAFITPGQIKTLAKGIGQGSVTLEFIPRDAPIRIGDFIAVRAPSSSSPLLLAVITRIQKSPDSVFQTAEAHRLSHPEFLSEVGVIVEKTSR